MYEAISSGFREVRILDSSEGKGGVCIRFACVCERGRRPRALQ